ncbi:hypothetical protein KR054_010331, partial [Drosophila jambulina]
MNPACRLNLDSLECQTWLTAVGAHCAALLPTAEQASLWDNWWPNELPASYKTWVSTMSAFDCYRLRKEVANLVDGRLQLEVNSHSAMRSLIHWTIGIVLLLAVLIVMLLALRMTLESWRGSRSVEDSTSPSRSKNLKPILIDVESPPCEPCQPRNFVSFGQACQPLKPRSFISFGQRSNPLAGYGPYRYQQLVKTNSMQDYTLKEKP